ncbi:phosphotransferase family protein [Nocardia cyriacigeorgica]|uniref:phosphotransferase family protein n=1 Tax=Nocardia cyriacigeorgica TaxID=135487 RepID=UPI002453ED8A|nr:aminoglycoside phosphotransferase family protein [Nocardia cyriacigeorgica]
MDVRPADVRFTEYDDLLRELLPGERIAELEVREGQFHHVVLGADAVVCLPRTPAAGERLPGRAARLRTLGRLGLGVAVPQPLAVGGEGRLPYLVLTRIPGVPLDPESLGGSVEAVARQCHDLLAGLAAAGADTAIRAELPVAAATRWMEFAADVRAELYPLMSGPGRAHAERELSALDQLATPADAVVHGDLGGENLLWETTEDGPTLRGVVDWDDVSLGDPAEDYAALAAGFGDELLEALLTRADPVDATLPDRISTIRATFALQQALAAYRDEDADELADGLSGYR